MGEIILKEADKAEIIILVDNYSDLFLSDTDIIKRMKVLPPGAPIGDGFRFFLTNCNDTNMNFL